ncbi:MAG: GNAT family N-acetyltransferase [Actinobacteria bacterium]|nr:GNAT family N-acetyltransferase [Actinomycetota bacterium]
MKMKGINIERGLPAQHRRRAAEICYEGFRQKLDPLVGSREQSITVLETVLEPGLAVIATCRGEVAGLAGLHYDGHRFFNPRWSHVTHAFRGLRAPKAVLALLLMLFANRHNRPGQLSLSVIAVDPSMRGNGIGTLLLQAVFEFAQAKSFSAVSLDVADTNTGAYRLYERMGFVPTRTVRLPFLRRTMGVSGMTTMVKRII